MLTLIIGRGKTGKTRSLLEAVKSCPAMGMAQRIVIVPEQLSHSTERRLSELCGDEISFVSEVLSFTRLYNRVCGISGGGARNVLDATGRLLTAKLALDSIRHRLKVFASTAGRAEFLDSMVNIIDELKSYEITPKVLQETAAATSGMFAEKLSELALILETYEAATARGVFDPRDNLTLLKRMLREGGYAEGRHFFVDGFTDYSAQELGVLQQLLRDSENMTVTVPCDDLFGTEPLFAPGRETAHRLLQMASACGQETRVICPAHGRVLPEALTYLERKLFDFTAAPFEADASCIVIAELQDRLEECRQCGAVLKHYAMKGLRYRDMVVCTGDEAGYGPLFETVLRSMDIPVYRSAKKAVLSHPAAAFVLLALEAAVDNLETETVTAYLKTGYSGVGTDDCDAIENYAYVWKIRGSKWQTKWSMHPEGYDGTMTPQILAELDSLNAIKDIAIGPVVRLKHRLRSAENAAEQIGAVYGFLEETKLYESLEEEIQLDFQQGRQEQAQETAQIYSILLECLKQIHGVLGGTAPKTEELLRIIQLALGQYQVGTIPAVLDAVSFCSVDQVRGQEPKLLYVLGANEGVLPAVASGGSLLSERERCILRDEFEILLAPDSEKNMERQLLTVYSAMTSSTEKLYLSYCVQNGGEQLQPSFIVERMANLFPRKGQVPAYETVYTSQSAAETYLSHDGSMETAALAAVINRAAREITELAEAISCGKAAAVPRTESVSSEMARVVFGSTVSLTASRLDQLGKCPLNFFLNYGLKARVRKEAAFDAAEFGTFVHYILEKTVKELSEKGPITPIDREESAKMVAGHLAEYAESRMGGQERTPRQLYLFDRNGEEATVLLEEISHELGNSDFQPKAFELQFGGDGELPAVSVRGKLGEGKLTGFVDRADVWETEGEEYLRVVDYKSGTRKFDYTELYGGVGMQMLLYLFAMEQGSHKATVPAGVLYMPAKRPFASGDAEDESEGKIQKRSGLVLGETAVLEAMEHGEKYQYLPVKNSKSGPGDYAISRGQMDILKNFVEKRMGQAVDQILSGNFAPKPFYRGRSHDPCDYCDYLEVCQRDKQFRRTHYQEDISPKEFWTRVGGETDE